MCIRDRYRQEHNVPSAEIAAALAKIAQGDEPLLLEEMKRNKRVDRSRDDDRRSDRRSFDDDRPRRERRPRDRDFGDRPKRDKSEYKLIPPTAGMERFRIEVGYTHGVKPGNIVGAVANEAGLDSKHIGRIELYEDYSTVDLPEGMPKEVLRVLKKTWVAGQQMRISREDTPSKVNKERKNREFEGERMRPRGPSQRFGNKPRQSDR